MEDKGRNYRDVKAQTTLMSGLELGSDDENDRRYEAGDSDDEGHPEDFFGEVSVSLIMREAGPKWSHAKLCGICWLSVCLMVLQPEVFVDQEWRPNKSCLKTFPRHLLVLRKRTVEQGALVRSRESGSSSRSTVSQGVLNTLSFFA